jgi:uncharacterized protein
MGAGCCTASSAMIEEDPIKPDEPSQHHHQTVDVDELFRQGRALEKQGDISSAFTLFERAASLGHSRSALRVAYRLDVDQGDSSSAARWYRIAAEGGDAKAMHALGLCLAKGLGVVKDDREAVLWFERAAAKGYDRAQYNLALCLERGVGVAKDEARALEMYRLAAEQGSELAKKRLAQI